MDYANSPQGASSKLSLKCIDFRPMRRNTLVGFATIYIANLRLTIKDIAVHTKDGARWAALPARPQVLRDGTAIRNDAGKIQYTTIMEFDGRAVRDAFSGAVIRAVLEREPSALDEAAP